MDAYDIRAKMNVLAQTHPEMMLLYGIVVLVALYFLFRPRKGAMAWLKRMRKDTQRILLEDTLKYLFDCEYKNIDCNVNGIAGNLDVSPDKANRLTERLLGMGLVSVSKHTILLTETGRSYALRVVRVHRILERYFADETSLLSIDWHDRADDVEHKMTLEEAEKLAAQMNNPAFDPHGDPIPTKAGEMPRPKGKPLNDLQKGDIGYIIHIEDEPKSIYEQLMVLGLHLGMQVYITDVTESKITFVANGEECVLTPLFATHITVEVLSKQVPLAEKHDLLSSLQVGEKAEIVSISNQCRAQQRRRLMDLGIVPGSQITAEIKSASGDPVGYRVMGTTIGIRKKQADLIFINRNKKRAHEFLT